MLTSSIGCENAWQLLIQDVRRQLSPKRAIGSQSGRKTARSEFPEGACEARRVLGAPASVYRRGLQQVEEAAISFLTVAMGPSGAVSDRSSVYRQGDQMKAGPVSDSSSATRQECSGSHPSNSAAFAVENPDSSPVRSHWSGSDPYPARTAVAVSTPR